MALVQVLLCHLGPSPRLTLTQFPHPQEVVSHQPLKWVRYVGPRTCRALGSCPKGSLVSRLPPQLFSVEASTHPSRLYKGPASMCGLPG